MTSNKTTLDDPSRFEFGANWTNFLKVLNDERIAESELSLKSMLLVETLHGKTFLDIGSGSGLSSLSARRLGARVFSFDYDGRSVNCTTELRRRFFPNEETWHIEQGSAIDTEYMDRLGQFDVVYSWGVLHHTGAMWLGIENALQRVAPGGKFFLAIYNDQGMKSHMWWLIKWLYNRLPWPINQMYGMTVGCLAISLNILRYSLRLRPLEAIRPLLKRNMYRGMNLSHDMLDWVGGFPYEFAKFEVLEQYMLSRGFALLKGKKATSLGCHEQVFVRTR
jgi:SAM-dependent methyltransferase